MNVFLTTTWVLATWFNFTMHNTNTFNQNSILFG